MKINGDDYKLVDDGYRIHVELVQSVNEETINRFKSLQEQIYFFRQIISWLDFVENEVKVKNLRDEYPLRSFLIFSDNLEFRYSTKSIKLINYKNNKFELSMPSIL